MSDSDKPAGDLADSDAVTADEDGQLRVVMEELTKNGRPRDRSVERES